MNDELNKKLFKVMFPDRCWHEYVDDYLCNHCSVLENERHGNGENPSYTSDISDAFELVEWMRKERGAEIFIEGYTFGWEVEIAVNLRKTRGEHESLPMAISLAAIEVLGKEK